MVNELQADLASARCKHFLTVLLADRLRVAFEALAKFPSGATPDYCFMNRRSLEQLRKSRKNVTSATGVPTLPDNVAGIPIVNTDSLVNTEA